MNYPICLTDRELSIEDRNLIIKEIRKSNALLFWYLSKPITNEITRNTYYSNILNGIDIRG